ncbi:hypothetical protein ES702_07186 [subsurface metagenome]
MNPPAGRDVFAKIYEPKLKTGMQKVVVDEVKALKSAIDKGLLLRPIYLEQVPWDIKRFIRPTQWGYSSDVVKATSVEVGIDVNIEQPILAQFTEDYIGIYSKRYISSHLGQLNSMDNMEDVKERLDQWLETTATKRSRDESVRQNQAVFQCAVFSVGYSTTWRLRGKSSCPYCRSLAGKRIWKGGEFIPKMGEIIPTDPDKPPMKVYVALHHCPAHLGCDCFLSAP